MIERAVLDVGHRNACLEAVGNLDYVEYVNCVVNLDFLG